MTQKTSEELLKAADLEKIAREGSLIYDKIKEEFSAKKGQYLAINIETGEAFLGEISTDALEKAKRKYPNTVFYVVKIGFDYAETLAQSII